MVVAYDAGSSAFAARMWWLMRYFGQAAALLDGGLASWIKADLPLETGPVDSRATPIVDLQADNSMVVTSEQVLKNLELKDDIILDARARERFLGETEPLDKKAGHIPGSVNRYMQLNLTDKGKFKEPATLCGEFEAFLRETTAEAIVHSCGSGVTACQNLFAMELAGMGTGRLYPGSWSEWIQDPSRPTEKGQ